MPGHTHSLDTFWESIVRFGRKCQVTLTYWTHFERALLAKSSFTKNARSHSLPGHILRESTVNKVQFGRKCQATLTYWTHFGRALLQSPVLQEMPGHTHSLDTFWESTISKVQFCRRSHSHTGHILREHCQQSPVWQVMPLTVWTHFERALSAKSSLVGNARSHSHTGHILREHSKQSPVFAGNARSHSQPGHILRELCKQSPVLQEMPGYSHSLDTFWESTVSKVQFGRKCQVTLTPWTHFERALSVKSNLAGNARSHLQSGHILREYC